MSETYYLLFFFIIYAFFGWCLEVVYQAVEHGKFINRGFLNGPYCPIYGFGVIIVSGALDPIKGNLIVLYAGSVVLTSILELATGFLLDKIFSMHWWDYSGERLNLGGYICLKFSLLWGVACIVTVRLIHPAVSGFVGLIPYKAGCVIIAVSLIGFTSDLIVTVLAIIHYKKRILLLENIAAQMRKVSDAAGERLFGAVETAKARKEVLDEKNADNLRRLEELRERYRAYSEKIEHNIRRIMRSFPTLSQIRAVNFREQLEELRKNLSDNDSNEQK